MPDFTWPQVAAIVVAALFFSGTSFVRLLDWHERRSRRRTRESFDDGFKHGQRLYLLGGTASDWNRIIESIDQNPLGQTAFDRGFIWAIRGKAPR